MDFSRDGATPPGTPRQIAVALAAGLATAWAWAGGWTAAIGAVVPEAALLFPVLAALLAPLGLAAGLARVSRTAALRVAEVTWLVALPAWGFALDLRSPACDHGCEDTYQPLAWPGLAVVYLPYLAGLTAYGTHRLRPSPRGVLGEALVQAGLAAGIVVSCALAAQFGGMALQGLVFAAQGLPLAAPPVAAIAFSTALGQRAWSSRGAFAGATLGTAGWLGLDLLLHRAFTGAFGLWGGAFSQTCGWTFSALEPPVADCHYLCTVAAQGHPWLVRPLRTGTRRGHAIVVNRQLAVANAFEDLLHERWPRFGRAARRAYDALAFPVSAWLLHPLAADAVFLAMLPAQAAFELFLRAFDREPEARIDRMYR